MDKRSPSSTHPSRPSSQDSREALLQAAKQVFAEKGYEGATVKDLADSAGVNSSLISYHFGGKEGLYRTCLEGFGSERLEIAERILNAPATREEFVLRLRLFAEELLMIHNKDKDTCRMVFRGMEALDPISSEVFTDVFYRIFIAFQNFMDAAQKSGFIRSELNVETTGGLMVGSLIHTLRSQELIRILGKPTLEDPEQRRILIEHWTSSFTQGIFAPISGSGPAPGSRSGVKK